MKYIRFRVWVLFAVLILGFIWIFQSSITNTETGIYKSESPIEDEQIIAAYPDLYEAITSRQAGRLQPFLTHEHPQIRRQAWRALSLVPADSLSVYLELAGKQNTPASWFAISRQDLSADYLRRLEELWGKQTDTQAGIASVLGRQGDEQSLEFLLDNLQGEDATQSEHTLALAVSRLITRHGLDEQQQISVIQQAFEADDDQITRAYLYGWYRGGQSPLGPVARDTLFSRWQVYGTGTDGSVDQYVNRILPARTTSTMAIYYNGEQDLEREVQLSYELATSLGGLELNSRNALAAVFLLTHPNPHVQKQTLLSVHGKIAAGDNLYREITQNMIPQDGTANMVWLQALRTASLAGMNVEDEHWKRLESIPQENPYLISEVLGVYRQLLESPEAYLEKAEQFISADEPIAAIQALEDLHKYWQATSNTENNEQLTESIRQIVFKALDRRDRGVTYTAQHLLRQEELFTPSDFPRIHESLSGFSLPEDLEVYQAFGTLYKQRFEEQGRPAIDSWASQNNLPLNRSLADSGWEITVPEEEAPDTFMLPRWERIWELGEEPVVTVQTEKGNIRMQLNTLRAPATVFMMDSLSRSGAYANTPFHRVVPNFVIQGGDIMRGDGLGSPGFTLPTEASEKQFYRGAVGIASAGMDTESSQFFIMHQWKPHLNGNYTTFGKVIDGMEVVDQMIPGDTITTAGWQ